MPILHPAECELDNFRKHFHPVKSELLKLLTGAGYEPRYIADDSLGLLGWKFPVEQHLCLMGSGDVAQSVERCGLSVVGGLDWFRVGCDQVGKDIIKKNYFWVVENTLRPDYRVRYGTVGPFAERSDHYLPDIPDELLRVPILHWR